MDLGVIAQNWKFLVLQGLLGIGNFTGGTLRLAIPAIALGFLLGIFIGLARLAPSRWLRGAATAYVEFFRGVPLVMVIFWMWFIIPQLLRLPIPEYGVALSAFVIFEAAYFGEIVRAGVQSVPRGQVEASRAVGLSGGQTMRLVVLPQALRNMVPALVPDDRALQGHAVVSIIATSTSPRPPRSSPTEIKPSSHPSSRSSIWPRLLHVLPGPAVEQGS
jgi:His/Glu/Gln/Arg/opine family amino acid ABC transporter permease subunit